MSSPSKSPPSACSFPFCDLKGTPHELTWRVAKRVNFLHRIWRQASKSKHAYRIVDGSNCTGIALFAAFWIWDSRKCRKQDYDPSNMVKSLCLQVPQQLIIDTDTSNEEPIPLSRFSVWDLLAALMIHATMQVYDHNQDKNHVTPFVIMDIRAHHASCVFHEDETHFYVIEKYGYWVSQEPFPLRTVRKSSHRDAAYILSLIHISEPTRP